MDNQSLQRRLNTISQLKERLDIEMDYDRYEIEQLDKYEPGTTLDIQKKRSFISRNNRTSFRNTEEILEKKSYLSEREKLSDVNFFNKLKPLLDQLPESNGSRFYNKINTNIGIIADEFLFNSFKDIANFFYIERKNYKNYSGKLDVLLIVTTWKGLNYEWKGLGNPNIKRHRQDLYKIIEFYRSQGTKIVFYSKEDPVNYHIFLDIAKQCDYIFTTAEEKVDDYKRDCNNSNVQVLEFGINPYYHNPIGSKKFPKRQEVLFTGSWYEKYPHRHVDTRMLFDGVIDAGKELKIIDRNFNLNLSQYFFPVEYLKFVSPEIEHTYLQKFHKLFDFAINLNSVKESTTMFANRIYELQALGNIMLSNYSVGVNNKFPNIFLIHNKNEVKEIINNFSEKDIYEHQVHGIRRVMSNETSFHRVAELLNTIGLDPMEKARKVAVVVKEKSPNILRMFNAQTYKEKEIFLEEELSEEVKKQFDMVAFWSGQYFYGEFYLEDMVNGFKYTDSDYITKDAYYQGNVLQQGVQYDYVNEMKDKYRTLFWGHVFTVEDLVSFNGKVSLSKGFSIDPFSFNKNQQAHSFVEKDYQLSVIIPTYNNGEHLLHKCFNSLKRSSVFKDMEIIIVDDGSTDGHTTKIITFLEKEYDNVKSYYYLDGGSGSASRPRNKGFELSTAPYITYLDPDNEAINDGFFKLLKETKKGKYDLVVGNMLRIDTKPVNFDYYRTAIQFYGSDVITKNVKQYLFNTQFKAMSIQALIAKRELIGDFSLKMVEGAAGQDTIFFQELLLHSKKTKVINEPIHIYYAAVSGSTVNTITKKFFEKYLILEKYRYQMLKNNGLLEMYLEKRFEYYFSNWYLKKLKNVNKEDALDSIKLLGEVLQLYQNDLILGSEEISEFSRLVAAEEFDKITARFVR